MNKLKIGTGLFLATTLTLGFWLLSDNESNQGAYQSFAEKVGLKYELVKPRVKENLYSKSSKRGPSSIASKFISDERDAVTFEEETMEGPNSVGTISTGKIKNRLPNSIATTPAQVDYFDRNFKSALQEQIKSHTSNSASKSNNEKTFSYAQAVQADNSESSTDEETNAKSENTGSNNTVIAAPKIQGTIPPLNGLITKIEHGLFQNNVYAAVTCTDPKIELFDLITMTPLEDNPITFNGVDESTSFSFDVNELNLDQETPARYKIKITGCSEELEKIVSSFYSPQDITAVSSLLAKITNTDVAYNPTKEFAEYLNTAEEIITKKIDESVIDYATIYTELENSTDAVTVFNEITSGEDVTILKEAAPKIKSLSIPTGLTEGTINTFTTTSNHWDSDYTIAYEWVLDGSIVSNSNTWDYIPPSNSASSATITLRVGRKNSSDNNVDISIPHHEFNYTLEVDLVNDAPTLASSQSITVVEDTVHSFTLTEGEDVDSPSLSYIITSTPTNGTLTCNTGTNDCNYTPNPDYIGNDSFTYKVNDTELDSTEATVNITITNINDRPVIGSDQSFTLNEDSTISLTLNQATDIDNTQASLTYKIVSSTNNGTLSNCITTGSYGQDLTCDYTPNANFNGNDSFKYIANDGSLDSSASATVSLTITPVNDAPTLASTQAESTNEDTVLNFNLNSGSDIEGTSLNYTVVTNTTNGILTCNEGTSTSCTYAPNNNFNGSDSFTYKVDDSDLDSNIATVTITVNSINDAPVMAADQVATTNEDVSVSILLSSATDIDGDSLSYKIVNPVTNGTLSNCITTGSYGTDLSCDYTPNANYNGTDSFTFIANDSTTDAQTQATVSITINAVNDAPTLALTQTESTNEDTVLNFNLNSGSDIEGDSLSYIIETMPANGTLICDEGLSTACSYTPQQDYNGTTTFTYKVNDGQADSTTATVTINVISINDAPVMAADQSFTTNEDTAFSFTINNATDVDGDSLVYKLVTAPTNGTLSNCITTGYGTDLTCDYTPNTNFNGTDSLTYIANDSVTDAVTNATINFTINAVNDAPTLASTQTVSTNEDTPLNFTLNNGFDVEGDTLEYIIVSNPSDGTLACDEGTSNACTYTPDSNYNGSTTFTYKVNDGALDSNVATVTINVTSENDAPVMVADQTETTNEDTVVNFNLNGATDVDLPAQTLQYKLITTPTNGILSNCITNGSYTTDISCTYTPNANFNGSDSFTYRANDTLTDSSTDSTVTINITPINDAPTLASTQSISTDEDTALNFNLNAGSDIEGSTLSYLIVTTPGSGTLTCTGGTSRACTYTPATDFNGSTTFTYKVNDGELDSTTATVTVNINSVNDVPVMAADQSHTTNEDTLVNFSLNGATDVDGDTLTYKLVTAPTNGTLTNCITTTYSSDLTCTYTPSANYNGTDSFTYVATDGTGVAVTNATVNFTITPVNDAPTLASTQTITTNEDSSINFNLNAGNDIEGTTLSYIIVSNPGSGTLTCTGGSSQACSYSPAANFNGTTSFTYKVNDGELDSTTATVTVNIASVNDLPVMAADQSESTNEDTAVNFTLNGATDVDGDTLTYKVVSAPSNGTLSNCIISASYGSDISCTYTPNTNYNGSDSFTYVATDGTGVAVTNATVSLTINPVNDAPTLAATQSVSTNEDTVLNFNLTNGSDIDGDTLSYIKVTDPASGALSCTGGTSQACTYTPALNFNGTTTFTYKVNDGALDSTTATVTITVNSINDAPVMASDQSFTTDDNTALSITLSNATDVDGDSLTYKITSAPSNGTLSGCITTGSYGTDLTCTYTSNVNFNGIDSFTFIANDGSLDAATSETVTITVNDKTPSNPPTIALTSATYTSSTANTFTVSSCSDIASVLINEGSQPAVGDAGWSTCTTTASATTYTLASTTQGLHILKAWSKDPNGNVSTTSEDIYVYYDTVNPTLALTTPTIQKGGNNINLAWNATDESTSSAQNFNVEFYNGSTWSTLGTTSAINGPITSQAFTHAWTVPAINTTTARFRVSFTDLAGNSATIQSNTFTIDSIAPVISYTSPANNSYHLSSTTITGNCESGLDINISGDIQADFSTSCSGGTFSQTVNFSDNDGSKILTINQIDAAGNSTSVSRTFIRDEVAPIMTKTAGVSPDFTNANTPNAWSGTCEGNYTIYVTGDEATSFNCSSGSWSWTPSAKTADGTYVYNLVQTDAAGNTSSPALSLSWERDATPPAFEALTPLQINVGENPTEIKFVDSVSLSGSCEGNNVISISGTEDDTISCSSSNWSWTSSNYTTDGTRTFTFTQADSAGNTSEFSYTWTRDSNFPALAIDLTTIKNNDTTATFSGSCEDGLTITITGAQADTTSCSSGVWSWTTATTSTDLSNTYNFAQTNASNNTTNISADWIRETGLPVVSSISTSAPNPSSSNFIPYTINANSQNSTVFVAKLCVKTDDANQPTENDGCWIEINSPTIGLALAQNVTINDYSHLLGWEPATFNVYAWVMDEAGNISANTATLDTDMNTIGFTKSDPPAIWDVAAANSDTTSIPPTRSDSTVPTGTDVYIRWKVSDVVGLASNAINIYYTQDEQSFTAIAGAQGIAPHTNHNCPAITLAANEGCFKWTGGSPVATSYKVRVKVTNPSGVSTQLISTPLNADKIKIIAGNTEAGLGGDARTALFFNKEVSDSMDANTMVFSDDGKIYFADYKRGVLIVDPADGKQKLFIPKTGTSTGDGGPAQSATLNYPLKITLDYQGRLLIFDYNRIRRVDINMENPTIETIIGGGSSTADTVADPLDLKISHAGTWSRETNAMLFTPLPNGDLYFHSENSMNSTSTEHRMRVFKSATGQIESFYLTGTGDAWQPTQDLSPCRIGAVGLKFNQNTSVIEGITGQVYHHKNYTGCGMYTSSSDYTYARAYFDPTSGESITALDNGHRWYNRINFTGMDGLSYVSNGNSTIYRNNFDGTYTKILGSGVLGECADGTLATSCNVDIFTAFVTKTSKIYFNDRGKIRTIDEDGNVITVFGQGYGYGDDINAVNSRFANISRVVRLNNGKVVVNDTSAMYYKEFTPDGNIEIVAGNGSIAGANTTAQADTQPIRHPYHMAVDRATGNIYSDIVNSLYGNIAMLNRTTGVWEHILSNSSGTPYYEATADGLVGSSIDVSGSHNRGYPAGFANGHLFLNRMRYDSTNKRYDNYMLKKYDSNDSYRQSHVIGKLGYENLNESCTELRTAPVDGSTCAYEYWDNHRVVFYDSNADRYISAKMYRGAQRRVFAYNSDGTVEQIAYTSRNIDDGYAYARRAGVDYIYYCHGSRLYGHNITTNSDLGPLSWSMTGFNCRGVQFDYNPTNDSIIFPFEQNGLYGVAEYFLD